MLPRPKFSQWRTSQTLTNDNRNSAAATENDDEKMNSAVATESRKDEPNNSSSPRTASLWQRIQYTILPIAIFIMLVWPWIFFGVVWGFGGLEMDAHLAKRAVDNPHTTNYFVTFIANIASTIIGTLVSMSVVRFARTWVAGTQDQESVTIFRISLLTAFKHHTIPWSFSDRGSLFVRGKWFLVLLVVVWMGTFTAVTPAITSLITPVTFNKTAPINGTELNFASNAPECVSWFNAHILPETCGWQPPFEGIRYTTCLAENQLADVLESGRSSILSLISNNSESLAFSQLGATDGLHFLGPIRGVLPPGPLANGVPTLNTLSYPSVLDNTDPKAEKIYYNYTLDLQGLTSDIKCIYDTQSPVDFLLVPGGSPFVYQYTGTCSGLEDVLQNSTLIVPNSNHSLGFWACKVPGNSEQYLLYLRGRVDYENAIGNITCTLSTMQPAIFPVAYQSRSGYFSSQNYTTTFANTSSDIILRAIKGIGAVIYESQNTQSNLVAESVITFGVKSYDLPPNNQNETYLQLYGAMFQGILEYEAAYTRMIYSRLDPPPPSSCSRFVTGNVSYGVTGWSVDHKNIGFLLPMTLVILAALILVIVATTMGDKVLYEFDPTDPRSLIFASGRPPLAERDPEAPAPGEWFDRHVDYNLQKAS